MIRRVTKVKVKVAKKNKKVVLRIYRIRKVEQEANLKARCWKKEEKKANMGNKKKKRSQGRDNNQEIKRVIASL